MRYIETKTLPPVLKNALESVGYHRADVQVEAQDVTDLSNHAYGKGFRAFTCVVDLANGKHSTAYGSWGGDNMFSRNPMDKGEQPGSKMVQLPGMTAVIKGQEGGGRPVSARIIVHPETLAPMLPAPKEELTADEQKVLDVFCGYKPAARREELARPYKGEPIAGAKLDAIVDALVSRGYFSRNKAGAVSVTTKGKNARKGRGW